MDRTDRPTDFFTTTFRCKASKYPTAAEFFTLHSIRHPDSGFPRKERNSLQSIQFSGNATNRYRPARNRDSACCKSRSACLKSRLGLLEIDTGLLEIEIRPAGNRDQPAGNRYQAGWKLRPGLLQIETGLEIEIQPAANRDRPA